MNYDYELFRAKKLINAISPFLKMRSMNILDYGCGDGIFSVILRQTLSKKGQKISLTGYDVGDFRLPRIKSDLQFITNLSEIDNRSINICTLIDVVHHMQFPKNKISRIVFDLNTLLAKLTPKGLLIVKDYLLDNELPYKFLQKYSLIIKDVFANPKEMSKGFSYLTKKEWDILWQRLQLETIESLPFYYLPFEKYYAKITGKAWLWVLQKK